MITLKKGIDTIYTMVKAPISKPFELGIDRKLLILANGPSAKEFWDKEEVRNKFGLYDLMCMNHAIYKSKEDIFKYKPLYFILLDPVFFKGRDNDSQSVREYAENARKNLYEVLENIDWNAYFITNYHGDITLKNEKFTIVRLNKNTILPTKNRYYKLYKKNLANPGMNTVLDGALFFGITYGYKEIALLGTEFDFFKNIIVDENNMILNNYDHFYKENYKDSKVRIATHYSPEGSLMAYYLHRMSDNFSRFFILNEYAKYYDCKIYNYTKNSMIDAFERKEIIY